MVQLVVTYSEFFDNIDKVDYQRLLKDFGKEELIEVFTHIISSLNFKTKTLQESEFEFTNNLILSYPPEISSYLSYMLNKIQKDTRSQPMIFFNVNCMFLIQVALKEISYFSKVPTIDKEINLFKSFLLFNEYFTKRKETIKNDENISRDEKFLKNYIPMLISDLEFLEDKDVVVQSLKFKKFIEFLEQNNEYNKYLTKYYIKLKVKNWKEYLKYIWFTYAHLYQDINHNLGIDQLNYVLRLDRTMHTKEIEFWNSYSVNNKVDVLKTSLSLEQELDFKLLRQYPVYKKASRDNRFIDFIVLNVHFIADKLYQSVRFEFGDVVKESGGRDYYNGFNTDISDHFTHKKLLHETLDYCFENFASVKRRGDIKEKKEEDYSDYYLRSGNKIFLFELKDCIMNASTKHSMNYRKIFQDIKKNFINPKGSLQLLNVMERINNGKFNIDKIESNRITIYPIIVYTDISYSCNGINYLVLKDFKSMATNYSFKSKVVDVTMINIDFFIRFQDLLSNRTITLDNVIDNYIHYISEESKDYQSEGVINETMFTDFYDYFKFIFFKNGDYPQENPIEFIKLSDDVINN